MQKLIELRKQHNLTQQKLAEILNVDRTSIGKYEKHDVIPSKDILIKISEYFGVSIDYLFGVQRDTSSIYELFSKHKDLIDLYENANEQARKIAKFALEVGKRDSRQDNNYSNTLSEPDNTSFEYIRHYFISAAAGYASPIEGEDYELIERDKNTPSNADFCINIDGDSMEPYIHDGELVYVQRDTSLADFDVGIFFVDGDVLCKQYCIDNMGNLYLLSANPQREDANRIISRESSSTVVCFGKVLLKNKLPKPNYY